MPSSALKRALNLADQSDASWIDLAKALSAAKEQADGSLKQFFALRPQMRRTGYYLIMVWEHFSKLDIPKDELADVGWTKLVEIVRKCEAGTEQQWVTAAAKCTVPKLRIALQTGKSPTGKTYRLRFDLLTSQYKVVRAALLMHGAKPAKNGVGLDGKEKALINVIKAAHS